MFASCITVAFPNFSALTLRPRVIMPPLTSATVYNIDDLVCLYSLALALLANDSFQTYSRHFLFSPFLHFSFMSKMALLGASYFLSVHHWCSITLARFYKGTSSRLTSLSLCLSLSIQHCFSFKASDTYSFYYQFENTKSSSSYIPFKLLIIPHLLFYSWQFAILPVSYGSNLDIIRFPCFSHTACAQISLLFLNSVAQTHWIARMKVMWASYRFLPF